MNAPGSLIESIIPVHDARTVQQRVVDADPRVVYGAIWQADLMSSRSARTLITAAGIPELIAARLRHQTRPPGAEPHWRLAQALDDDSPWILVGERPGAEVVLGLLWTPPAGGTTCAPEEFTEFRRSGVAKVAWSLAVVPYGSGSVLLTETRTLALDDAARQRFRALWPLIGPFAGIARGAMLRAIARHVVNHGAMPRGSTDGCAAAQT